VIGAVVPVCNRKQNLELLLASLEEQTYQDFVLVVADDGSTDGTREMLQDHAASVEWRGRLAWVGCGPDRGVRTGRARNIGVANLSADTELLVMLDSDLLLQPTAMARFAEIHAKYPKEVILGAVEWLPPLEHEEILGHVCDRTMYQLRGRVPADAPERVKGTFTGPELREHLRDSDPDVSLPLRPEWALPLNSGWPIDLYWRIGGFEEAMTGYGYQDMEFGARAVAAGATCLFRRDLWALHVWHAKSPKAMIENQHNLDFYLRRHGSNQVIETDVDWSLWWHYHAERGGTVAECDGRFWAVNHERQYRMQLPDASWLTRLGHCTHAAISMSAVELQRITKAPRYCGKGGAHATIS
jgi:glycosyltransferase involved in cell wall biosynthesis